MKRRLSIHLTILLFLMFLGLNLNAQVNKYGIPVIHTYDNSLTGGSEWNYNILKDNRGILYFGNESNNILEFDGVNWKSIYVTDNPVIWALEKDPDGIIYAGGSYEFGYLEPDISGQLKYKTLSNRIDSLVASKMGDVFNIKYFNDNVYFVTKATIFRYNRNNDLLDTLMASNSYFTFQEIYEVNGRLFISDNRAGLVEVIGDTLSFLPGSEVFGMDYCMSVLPFDDERLLVGSFSKGLFLYNPETGEVDQSFISAELNEALQTHKVFNGMILPDGNFAFGTTSGGIFVFNREGELVLQLSNLTTEMEDDQTYHMYMDEYGSGGSEMWVATVGYINKIALDLPFSVFGKESNINFSLVDIRQFNGSIYAGGDKGVLKSVFENNRLVFKDIEGLNDQVVSMSTYEVGMEEFLLVGGLSGLFIIDKNDKITRFADIVLRSDTTYTRSYVREVYQSRINKERFYIGTIRKINIVDYKDNKWTYGGSMSGGIQGKVQSFAEESESKIWFSTVEQDKLYYVETIENDSTIITEYSGSELDGVIVNKLDFIDNQIYISTSSGIFRFNRNESKFELDENLMLDSAKDINYVGIVKAEGIGYYISAYDYQSFDYLVKPDGSQTIMPFYFLPKSHTSGVMIKDNKIWLTKSQEIYVVDPLKLEDYTENNEVLIRTVRLVQDSVLFGGTFFDYDDSGLKYPVIHQPSHMVPKISHSLNDITFTWASNNLVEEDSTVYSFMIENFDKDWSHWDKLYYKDYTNLPNGKYIFKVRARGVSRQVSEVAEYRFEIARAWYQSLVAMFVYMVLIVLVIVAIIKVYTRRLINENARLEGIVAQRTKEVVRQKDELEASIHYASRIQRAILPTEKSLKDKVEDYFILFRPRDIVSGDFYWVSEKGPRLFIVAADCTGHGVPGAFMSILGVSFLDEIINKTENTDTDVILNQLRTHVTDSLKQLEGGDEETKDGMDLGLLVINYTEEKIEYSGAYNPCWVVRELTKKEQDLYLKDELELDRSSLTNGKHLLESIDADRMPIGVSSRMAQSFTMHTQKLDKGVSYYLLSDGYSDQFGGERGRKFLKKNLKKLILDVQGVPMKQQRDLLEKRLIDWMGDQEQVDDILIMGIKAV